jgi:hypothetical protein
MVSMSKSVEGMCDAGGGIDHGKEDSLVKGTFREGFNQGEVDGQDQKSIPRPTTFHSPTYSYQTPTFPIGVLGVRPYSDRNG